MRGPSWRPPEEFDEYRIVRELGAGAMGQVYLAHDTLLDRPVAVKFLGAGEISEIARERFLIEARALARLQHPNVVTVYRVGELGRRPYLVSEFIHGESLDKIVKPVPWQRVRELAIMLSRGLAAAHRRGVLHRDIKPANTILASDDNEVKLLDFGLAKLVDTGLSKSRSESFRLGSSANRMAVATASATPRPAPFDETQDFDAMGPTGAIPADRAKQLLGDDATMASGSNPRLDDAAGAGTPSPMLTRDGAVMGTPYYMAPEAWRGEQATARSDIYSLGVLLYELACGAPPHRDIPVPNLSARIQVERAKPLAERVLDVDAKFAAIVDRCLALDPADRFVSADELREALEALTITAVAQAPAIPEGNPYRGLRTFEAEHRALFFGRNPEVRSIVERLRTDPFVLVAGDSGLGKSSLVRAGVIPSVLDGALGAGRTWRAGTIVPGRRPVVAIAGELARQFEIDEATLESDLLRRDTVAIEKHRRTILKSLSKHQQGFLLAIDQLEELVTIADPEEATAAVDLLAALFSSSSARGIRLVATVRGDFLTRVASLPWIGEELAHALYVLRPMTADGIRDAIVGPARAKGVTFEPASLVDELVGAAQTAGSLPLLQFALAELWEARPADAKTITSDALSAIGGVEGALARHADRVVAEMLPEVRTAARRILVGLISAKSTRARRTRAELVVDDASGKALEALVRGRLVSVRDAEGEAGYEVAHEALLSRWDTLRNWLDSDGELRTVRRRIEAAAAEWERAKHSRDALWRDRRLVESERLSLDELSESSRSFLLASRGAVRRARRSRHAIAVALPLAIIILIVGVRLRIMAAADEREREARLDRDARVAVRTTGADKILEQAHSLSILRTDRTRALALFDVLDPTAEAVWTTVIARSHDLDTSYSMASQELEHALVIDPQREDVRRQLAEILHRRAELAHEGHQIERRDELLRRLALYDTAGDLIAKWSAPARLQIDLEPTTAQLMLSRIVAEAGRRVEQPASRIEATHAAPPGDYVLVVTEANRTIRLPLRLHPGETLPIRIAFPEHVPEHFVFIPAGRFLVGTSDEGARTSFLGTVPLHEIHTKAYMIARHETTFAEWIEFLEALSPADRELRRPRPGAQSLTGEVNLVLERGAWTIKVQPTTELYVARRDQPLRYLDRTTNATQDWTRFPVAGVTLDDIRAYTSWLHATGRVVGARPCTELEWERAARGADDREFPHGDVLRPNDANFDETYGKQARAFGLDEVGRHPASRSPFGIDDMAGNVFELTVPALSNHAAAARGGAYYFGALTNRSTNRWTLDASLRSSQLGVRVCADAASP